MSRPNMSAIRHRRRRHHRRGPRPRRAQPRRAMGPSPPRLTPPWLKMFPGSSELRGAGWAEVSIGGRSDPALAAIGRFGRRRRCRRGTGAARTRTTARRSRRNSNSADDSSEPHADAECCRTIAAAGRSTLADSLESGAHSVLAEAAGKMGIGGIFAQALERRLILRIETQRHVAEARDLDAVRSKRRLNIAQQRRLDLGGTRRQAQHRPFLGGEFTYDAGAQYFENLLTGPIGNQIIRRLARADELQNHCARIADYQRILAEDTQSHREVRFRILDIVDGAPEREADELARPDKVEFGPIHVGAARPVDDVAQKRDERAVESRSTGRQRARNLAFLDEQSSLVGLHRDLGQLANRQVGPFIEDLFLGRVGTGNELAVKIMSQQAHGVLLKIRNRKAQSTGAARDSSNPVHGLEMPSHCSCAEIGMWQSGYRGAWFGAPMFSCRARIDGRSRGSPWRPGPAPNPCRRQVHRSRSASDCQAAKPAMTLAAGAAAFAAACLPLPAEWGRRAVDSRPRTTFAPPSQRHPGLETRPAHGSICIRSSVQDRSALRTVSSKSGAPAT